MDIVAIRPIAHDDLDAVRSLFVHVNRALAPPSMRAAFDAYIARALREEIELIEDLYDPAAGHGFWVAAANQHVVGMVGLQRLDARTAEIRRLYVDPGQRRQGIGRALLHHVENEARLRGCTAMHLDTAEIQTAAIALYRTAGYRLHSETIAEAQDVRAVGHGMKRLHFTKPLCCG